jgi:hypothetical protein
MGGWAWGNRQGVIAFHIFSRAPHGPSPTPEPESRMRRGTESTHSTTCNLLERVAHRPPMGCLAECGSTHNTFDEPCNNRPTHWLNSPINLVASPLLAYSSANVREASPTP